MGLIALEGMEFHANHGVYEEEQISGTQYSVDLYIETSYESAAAEDDLAETINYETVYRIVEGEMRKQSQLIETILHRIIDRMKHQFGSIQEIKVRVRKHHPFPGERVKSVYVEEEDSFVSKCPRCGSPFICYTDEHCWCMDKQIHPKTQENIRQQFGGCLCNNCLDFYAG